MEQRTRLHIFRLAQFCIALVAFATIPLVSACAEESGVEVAKSFSVPVSDVAASAAAPGGSEGVAAESAMVVEPTSFGYDPEAADGEDDPYADILAGEGLVTAFIGEPFYDEPIESETDALAAIQSVMGRLGGDGTVVLAPIVIRPMENGTTYYVFRQRAGDVLVHGACVKLAVDSRGTALGVVSALVPNVAIPRLDEWAITRTQAEAVTLRACAKEGYPGAKVVKGATEQTLIALESGEERYRFAWAVYTENFQQGTDAAYRAHYVSEDGKYLQSMPVSRPGGPEALAGDAAPFSFDAFEQGTWSGSVPLRDGSMRDVEVPTLTDPKTGRVFLGDARRKILCAEYADFQFDDVVSPRELGEGAPDGNEVLVYDLFIRIWDFFESIGWKGPDGNATPSLVLFNLVDEQGNPENNAYYTGRRLGFQTFSFGGISADGEAADVMAHEFAHCVTQSAMTTSFYVNDYGALNESMSDILGNLAEIFIDGDDEGTWIIGEDLGEGQTLRSMADPHAFGQPEYVWDEFYVPQVLVGTELNDYGGVHVNSSLLNLVAYKLGQSEMSPQDQFYYWMNVALAMTPSTDFAQMAELLPWCMSLAGQGEYAGVLEDALSEAGFSGGEFTGFIPQGCGLAKIKVADAQVARDGMIRFILTNAQTGRTQMTYPAAGEEVALAIVEEGDYFVEAEVGNGVGTNTYAALEGGWMLIDPAQGQAYAWHVFHVAEGETLEIEPLATG